MTTFRLKGSIRGRTYEVTWTDGKLDGSLAVRARVAVAVENGAEAGRPGFEGIVATASGEPYEQMATVMSVFDHVDEAEGDVEWPSKPGGVIA